mgnify:CR=1 FL=1
MTAMKHRRTCQKPRWIVLVAGTALLGLVLAAAAPTEAGQFRSSKRIGGPSAGTANSAVKKGGAPSFKVTKQQFAPIDRRQIETMVRKTLEKWNTPEFPATLNELFPDKDKVVETQNQYIPKDARLRVLSFQSVQTLSQNLEGTPGGDGFLVSKISVTVKTQMEYSSASLGFKKFEGRNELILNVRQKLAGSGS